MEPTLYRNGLIRTPCDPHATALLVADGAIAWVGQDADAPAADRTVDLDAALVTPAFVDAHVHLTDTGLALTGLDLSGVRSAAQLLAAVAGASAEQPPDAVLIATGWDDSTWDDPKPPNVAELDRAAGGRMLYAAQASMHSALCSSPVLAHAEGRPGYDDSGWVRREAHHGARRAALGSIGAAQRAAIQRSALARAASLGIASVHECGGPGISSEEDFTIALSHSDGPQVYGYWGELSAVEKARELGAIGAGGDLFADGALGSHTAHLREPYLDREGSGYPYISTEEVRDHLLACDRAGLPGGFHAIGDAAIGTVLAGFQQAAQRVGADRLRSARHRMEHAELLDRDAIAGLVTYGVIASVQPAFDRLWGGEEQMYARRLGPHRALAANPFAAMHAVGVALAFGSDSPVTPLDPWGSVRAAAYHHNPAHRVSVRAGFAAHTRGGWRAVGEDEHGVLTPGAPATFAVWHTPDGRDGTLPVLTEDATLPTCLRTVLRGETIYETET
jgi:predicted amidohydrolase YtcJ